MAHEYRPSCLCPQRLENLVDFDASDFVMPHFVYKPLVQMLVVGNEVIERGHYLVTALCCILLPFYRNFGCRIQNV